MLEHSYNYLTVGLRGKYFAVIAVVAKWQVY